MKQAGREKLADLRADYAEVTGSPFEHFFCPILYRDEETALCRGHIINQRFRNSDRTWTVQRKDVDNFYGSLFEKEFLAIQEKGQHSLPEMIADGHLQRWLSPRVTVDGDEVEYYVVSGNEPPDEFSEVVLELGGDEVRLALKMHPDQTTARLDEDWTFEVEKDVRLEAFVSLLKAAHLTLFSLLGYRYALTAGGRFLGKRILGEFFEANRDVSPSRKRQAAKKHFAQFDALVRPIISAPEFIRGTVSDGYLHLCGDYASPWAFIVFVKTGQYRHGVVVPNLVTDQHKSRFEAFLEKASGKLLVTPAHYKHDRWYVRTESNRTVEWPEASVTL